MLSELGSLLLARMYGAVRGNDSLANVFDFSQLTVAQRVLLLDHVASNVQHRMDLLHEEYHDIIRGNRIREINTEMRAIEKLSNM